MTREEFMMEAALRLLPICDIEKIPQAVKELAKSLFKEIPETEYQESNEDLYDVLYSNLSNYKVIACSARRRAVNALMGKEKYVTVASATGIASLYDSVTIDDVKIALENKKIEGTVPQKKKVVSWNGNTKVIRQAPDSIYKIDTKSLINWLESNYTRKFTLDTPISKCISKLKAK